MKFLTLLLIVLVQFVFMLPPKAYAYSNPATVPLGTVSNFAALGHTTTTSAIGGTVLNNGDLGIDADCTGFPSPCLSPGTGTINNGVIHQADGVVTIGQTDATDAVSNITGRGTADQTIAGGLLGGQILTQGVYDVPATTTNLTGDLTLNGNADSVFIFRMESTLKTATGSRVILGTGVQACNVFWMVASSATFNDTTTFAGTVLAQASISFPGGGATLNGRVIAQTGAITFNNTTVNNSSCASPTPTPMPTTVPGSTPTPTPTPASSAASGSAGGSSVLGLISCPSINTVSPTLLESRRVDADSIFISWGPYAGIDTFTIRYGLTRENLQYNTDVVGFSTNINNLPYNQSIWVQIAARNSCSIGNYGEVKLVGGASLPSTGFAPNNNNIPWNIVMPAGIFVSFSVLGILIKRKYRFSS